MKLNHVLIASSILLLGVFVFASLNDVGYTSPRSEEVSNLDDLLVEITLLLLEYWLLLIGIIGYRFYKEEEKFVSEGVIIKKSDSNYDQTPIYLILGTFSFGLIVTFFSGNILIGTVNLLLFLSVAYLLLKISPDNFVFADISYKFPGITFKSKILNWLCSPQRFLFIILFHVFVILSWEFWIKMITLVYYIVRLQLF